MKTVFNSRHALALAALFAACPAIASTDLLLQGRPAVTLNGTGDSWGFGAQDPQRPRLFIARRENGLTVFDTGRKAVIGQFDEANGANAVIIVPKHDRAYVPNTQGDLTVIGLSDLRIRARIPVAEANLNNGVYDPATDRVLITSGRRGSSSTLYTLDPASDKVIGQETVPAKKLDGPLSLPGGRVLLPWRDEGAVAVWDMRRSKTIALWRYPECEKPSALAYDEKGSVFIACRGGKPVLIVADAATGERKASLPTLKDINTLAYDQRRERLLAPSGVDAAIAVYGREGAAAWRLLGAVSSRRWAHNMVFSPARGEAYLFAADFTQLPDGAGKLAPAPHFHPDTFTILTFSAGVPGKAD
ncbi:YncE family protein [Achromobacter aloeverae]